MATRRGMLALGAAALPAGTARAQEGLVTLLVPYTPGTGPDLLARLLSPPLQQALGQPVVVENRPGASGNIGTQAVARASPDGRTLLLQANTFVMNPSLLRQVPYDPVGSFNPIIRISRGDLVLVVNPDIAAEDAQSFAALARGQSLDYASPGIGTPQHLGIALFGLEAKVALNHVPYRGSAAALTDLLGGRVRAMVVDLAPALPQIQAGALRPLAVTTRHPLPALPGVPTVAAAGLPGYEMGAWQGLLAPSGTPPAIVARLAGAVTASLGTAEGRRRLEALSLVPMLEGPEGFAAFLPTEIARWAPIVRASGATVD